MKTKKKNKGGRPRRPLRERVDFKQVEKLAAQGGIDETIAGKLGKCERTINRWKKDPEFLSALKKGKEKADSKVQEALYKRAVGFIDKNGKYYPPDTLSMIIWLKNRQPEKWRDRHELTGKDGESLGQSVFIIGGKEIKF